MAELVSALARRDALPAGGAVAGVVTALAATLLSFAADRSRDEWAEAGGAVAQARALQRRAETLAERDADAYALARDALAGPRGPAAQDDTAPEDGEETARRDWTLGRAVAAAADPPLALAGCAADVAQLAVALASHGVPEVRGDCVVAAQLAAAAAAGAAHLVEINLVAGADPARVGAARARAGAAGDAARSLSADGA